MKKILGLDLGTTSIGWALVNESETVKEKSSIIRAGVRVIPLTTDEENDFQKGKSISINADRTLKRGARRNLHRYKLRRDALRKILLSNNIIPTDFILPEDGKNSTHDTWAIRAKAASEKVTLAEFAKVLFILNKKRGYKSNRKAKDEDDGQAIDGMEVAKKIYEDNITPGQHSYALLLKGRKYLPSFYKSDLQNEFKIIWDFQKQYYPNILSEKLYKELEGRGKKACWSICKVPFEIEGIKIKGSRNEQKIERFRLRNIALTEKLDLESLAIVLQEINGEINSSSGYLGAISDRSKSLYFNKKTIGQYLNKKLKNNPHYRIKNQVFYRQDYLDEFDKIWETQSKFHGVLSAKLKKEIRDVIIFYQRRLKSQKGLISVCEYEGIEKEITTAEGKTTLKFIGPKVCPKSSPLFQEFKIWQILNNLKFQNLQTDQVFTIQECDPDLTIRRKLFDELNIKGKTKISVLLKPVVDTNIWKIVNFQDSLEGNNTNESLLKTYQSVLEISGHDINLSKLSKPDIIAVLNEVFNAIGVNTDILEFNSELEGKKLEQQAAYKLWHLLYSYEGDDSTSGNESLKTKLKENFGIGEEFSRPFLNIVLKDDYSNLSSKAIKKILPYLRAGQEFSEACHLAGYNHSHSQRKEDIENKKLDAYLKILPKNSLRNPVVEKILNQMINVINAIFKEYGKPDEIRIELARELKKSAKEREEMTKNINSTNRIHENYKLELSKIYPFDSGVRITRNDIIKYKLYKELEHLGHRSLFTNTYIPIEKLFSKEIDVEHIIPKAKLFDDSFSNKTLAYRQVNLDKADETAYDFLATKYGEGNDAFKQYLLRVEKLYKGGFITKAKYLKLKMKGCDIPDGFIERDLRNSQYIAKKARYMLQKIAKTVTPTSGSITAKLRQDWQLINVLQELNWEKFQNLGLTHFEKNKDGNDVPRIKDWTKRNDHRHHAMDAITVAFTKHNHIQYFNYQNARRDRSHKLHSIIYAIEQKETFVNERNKRLIKPPMPIDELRKEAKRHLGNILISFKAKNKVVTRNKNKIKGSDDIKIEFTPRGQLHKETVYGKSKHYLTKLEKVGPKFDLLKIDTVAQKKHRVALKNRLAEFENNPKKAFSGKNAMSKNPIYLDEFQCVKLPEKVKIVSLAERHTVRKDISPDLNVEKVLDASIKRILQSRLDDYDGESKIAFSNLEEDPIWLNREKGIQIKRVTISGIKKAVALHVKKDHFGKIILDDQDKPIPVDFVNTGNNHHVAIYMDDTGKFQEKLVTFYDAVKLKNKGLPIIDKNYNSHLGWRFLFTMKQNEMFVFPNAEMGFDPSAIDLLDEKNYHLISPNLFRVQKISTKNYVFNQHLETKSVDGKLLKDHKELSEVTYRFIQTPNHLNNIAKVRINHIGKIVSIGEY